MATHGVRAGYGSMLTRTLSASRGEWDHAMEQLPRVAALAQRLGFTRAGVVVLPFDDGLDPAANRKRHLARLREAAPVLADHGVRLGLEYVSPRTRRADAAFTFVHTMAALRELIAEAQQPNVGLMLDTFHWHCAGEGVDDLRALRADEVAVVHVNDAPAGIGLDRLDVRNRDLPGATGVIDLAGFMSALRAIGYDGPVTAEPTHPRWVERSGEEATAETAADAAVDGGELEAGGEIDESLGFGGAVFVALFGQRGLEAGGGVEIDGGLALGFGLPLPRNAAPVTAAQGAQGFVGGLGHLLPGPLASVATCSEGEGGEAEGEEGDGIEADHEERHDADGDGKHDGGVGLGAAALPAGGDVPVGGAVGILLEAHLAQDFLTGGLAGGAVAVETMAVGASHGLAWSLGRVG